MYIVYKTINLITNQIYIGVHKQPIECPLTFDGYLGSGDWKNFISKDKCVLLHPDKISLREAIKTYGYNNFKRETLYYTDNAPDAYAYEATLVTNDFIKSSDNYNLTPGGSIPPNHTNFIWITNGKSESRIVKDSAIPDGYRRGRLPVKESTKIKSRIASLKNGNKPPKHTKENGAWTVERIEKTKILLSEINRKRQYPKQSTEQRMLHSKRMTGEDNPAYGVTYLWITDGVTQIRWTGSVEHIPEGFRIGMKNKGVKRTKHEIVTCPHCFKSGGNSSTKRWHFVNCRFKDKPIDETGP